MYNKRARLGGMAKDAEAQALCHSEGYAAAVKAPTEGAGQCVIVIPAEPTGGFPRGARE